MKNLILAFPLLFAASPAFAAESLQHMIDEVHYQAKECGNSVIKSGIMMQDNHDPEDMIQAREARDQTACDETERRRMDVLNRLSDDQPKPDVKPGWFHKGTSPLDSKINHAKADRETCVITAMRKGIDDAIAGEERAGQVEESAVDACMHSASQRIDEILLLN